MSKIGTDETIKSVDEKKSKRDNEILSQMVENITETIAEAESSFSQKELDKALEVMGKTFEVPKCLQSIIDRSGVRPGNVAALVKSPSSLFYGCDLDDGAPVIDVADVLEPDPMLEFSGDPCDFGYLENRMAYAGFDLYPNNGIQPNGDNGGLVLELDQSNFFGADDDDPKNVAMCETNQTVSYDPIVFVSSPAMKHVNDAVKKFQSQYQNFVKGDVLVLGCGQVTLQNNFDFSAVTCVHYVDKVKESIRVLSDRLKDAPYNWKAWIGDAKDVTGKYDLIITNHSIHHIFEGEEPDKQFENCKKIVRLLQPKGAWIGAGPSITGLVATPKTYEVRSSSGLYGFKKKEGKYFSEAQFENVRYEEPVFFANILYGLPGVTQIVHLNQFVPNKFKKEASGLVRMFEGFAYLHGRKKPVEIGVCKRDQALRNLDLAMAVCISIKGKNAGSVDLIESAAAEKKLTGHSTGTVLNATHFSVIAYQGPLIISEKLNGERGSLVHRNGAITLTTTTKEYKLPNTYSSKELPFIPNYECSVELMPSGEIYWLETLSRNGKTPSSWIAGLRTWLYPKLSFKNYYTLFRLNDKLLETYSEGVVIQNPSSPIGLTIPTQYFFKKVLTVDIATDDGIKEINDESIIIKDRHDKTRANGMLRAIDLSFAIDWEVLKIWMGLRDECKNDRSPSDLMTLADLISYPQFYSSLGASKLRNTIVVQFWRGYLEIDEVIRKFLDVAVPWGLHQNAMKVADALYKNIIKRQDDTDGIIKFDKPEEIDNSLEAYEGYFGTNDEEEETEEAIEDIFG